MSLFHDLIAAQLLRFERPVRAPYDPAAGNRLLVAFVILGLVLQPALSGLAHGAGVDQESWVKSAIVVTLLLALILTVRIYVRLDFAAIGLHRWRAWTARERLYVCTVVPLAVAAFGYVFRERFVQLAEARGWVGLFLVTVPTGLLWGMVQEFIYRGLLQTELTRRFGGIVAVLLTNLAFTFGPLHFNYIGLGADTGPRWGMFAAIFGIGLFFGILYRRSGNLWIPALLHGLWPLNMT